jgi:cell division protein FtsI (penicillin-binding protein 3)
MSIGQEVSVTALQMVAAFGAVANGGLLVQPRIVRAVQDGAGREVARFEPRVVRRVISQGTARTLTEIMTRVVSDGTGRNAAIPDYDVAGKTGTAQKMSPVTKRYSKAPGVLSFVGFAPADGPRITMLVLLDEPRNERWGSEAAAPIFSAIGKEILRSMNVPPKDAPPVQVVSSPAQAPSLAPPQYPRAERSTPGVARAAGVARAPLDDEGPGAQRMPNLVGRSLREALATLASFDLPVEVKGRGVVVAQWPVSGDELQTGTVCRIELAPPTFSGQRSAISNRRTDSL